MSEIEDALEIAGKLKANTAENDNKKLRIINRIERKENYNPCLVTITDPHSAIAEEFRRFKSILIRETKTDFLNTVMITSSIENEGKSITSANLAVSLANDIDHSVLLVDADIRKPVLHEYLGIEYKYGLSDYLSGDIDISDILIKTGIGNLVFIPAGRMVENPVELLSSQKMQSLIKELKQRYMDRYIIIDTPPILSFSEGIAIASYVDGIVLVIRDAHVQKKTIDEALNIIKASNILGVVYNNVNVGGLDGLYSRYGYKYTGYKRDAKE